jgi:hypothetical protein
LDLCFGDWGTLFLLLCTHPVLEFWKIGIHTYKWLCWDDGHESACIGCWLLMRLRAAVEIRLEEEVRQACQNGKLLIKSAARSLRATARDDGMEDSPSRGVLVGVSDGSHAFLATWVQPWRGFQLSTPAVATFQKIRPAPSERTISLISVSCQALSIAHIIQ